MTNVELLIWVRGPGLQLSLAAFILGMTYRILQTYFLGRAKNLAEPRGSQWLHGMKTIWWRSFFHPGMTIRGYFTIISGYTFHLGFIITLLFFDQHIELFKSWTGLSWPALPAVLGIAALVAVLVDRIADPVRYLLSDYQDYLCWSLTVLPLVTGLLLVYKIWLPYTSLLVVHIISFEILLVAIPFTKLSHVFTIFIARWYNGAIAGYKGVQS